ncbi:MAG: ATP-dependent metallopeptidase FtsH/Yme1/Tma family protein [Cyanobacteria bacterium SIG30]|nr:ATP-dependent metallopeptidase FtsH/Yme1/Tma family protein [Cyanobacteria bacterium SIG30]
MNKNQSVGIWVIVGILVVLFLVAVFGGPNTSTVEISYSQFINKVKLGEISSVKIRNEILYAIPKSEQVDDKQNEAPSTSVSLKPALDNMMQMPQAQLQYKVQIPSNDPKMYETLEANGIEVFLDKPQDAGWVSSLLTTIFVLGLILLIFRGVQQSGSSAMNFGKSRAKMLMDNKVKVTFNDVAGIDEERQELEEIVDFLKNSDKYVKLGAKIPKGVLLVGAPGTGKTLMAKAVAGEAGVAFFSISGSDFVEMFVGVGASRVRDLFEQAKKHQPCIIFIDEIDAVGRQRGAGLGGGHDEREQTLNQLLVEMDGFDENTNIIILAATNRPDILDNALLRPGRFDRQIYVSMPDVKGREDILKVHAKNKFFEDDVDLKVLAKRTPGFTGADLKSLLNEAALLAARQNKDKISMEDIDKSIDRVIAGIEKKSKVMTDEDKEITSYHEVGHALIDKLLPEANELHKVSIIPRGMALGLTWTRPKSEKLHVSKQKLLARITMALGGRAAEEIIYGKDKIGTGASQDLQDVTNIAQKMVTQWGMSEKMGNLVYGKSQEHVFMGRDFGHQKDYSESIAAEIDAEIKRIVDEQYERAKTLLTENKDMLDTIARELLERETLDDTEFTEIMEKVKAQRGQGDNLG